MKKLRFVSTKAFGLTACARAWVVLSSRSRSTFAAMSTFPATMITFFGRAAMSPFGTCNASSFGRESDNIVHVVVECLDRAVAMIQAFKNNHRVSAHTDVCMTYALPSLRDEAPYLQTAIRRRTRKRRYKASRRIGFTYLGHGPMTPSALEPVTLNPKP